VKGLTLATSAQSVNPFPAAAIYIAMEEGPAEELREETMRLLKSQGYKPIIVPQGNVRQLRGGLTCIDLTDGGNIDSAVLMARGSLDELEPRFLCRVDYAVRGNIQGIPAGRRITNVELTWGGFIRKRLKALRWVVPPERESRTYYTLSTDGVLPNPGEVWEGGPHHVLTGLLNGDAELMEGIRGFATRLGDLRTAFNVFSDGWGESLRVSGGVWVKAKEVETLRGPRLLGVRI